MVGLSSCKATLIFAIGFSTVFTAYAGTINFVLRDVGSQQIPLPNGDATGADLTGADVEGAVQTELGTRNYQGFRGAWTRFGNASGGLILPFIEISLSGDSHSTAFQVHNTGNTYLLDVYVAAKDNPPFSQGTNAVFNTSSLQPGFTTDSSDGTVSYFYNGYIGSNRNTPYYTDFGINFDGFGLSPGASAYFLAPADFVVPEPRSWTFLGTGIVLMVVAYKRVKVNTV